jgi:hypothetical protein
MADITVNTGVNATFPTVYRIEETDEVRGGTDDSIDNLPHKQLTERTEYLKYRVDNPTAPDIDRGVSGPFAANTKFVIDNSSRFSDVIDVTANSNIALDKTMMGRLYTFRQTASIEVTLPDSASLPPNTVPTGGTFVKGAGIAFYNNSAKPVILKTAGSDKIVGAYPWAGVAEHSAVYLHKGETLWLFAAGSGKWFVVCDNTNSKTVGRIEQFITGNVPQGVLECAGQELLRADYPRLFLWALGNNMAVLESAWASDKGKFSLGDGSALSGTTFRVPDYRGLFARAVNTAGAGTDAGRTVGSIQQDELAEHNHGYAQANVTSAVQSGTGTTVLTGNGLATTTNAGGTETRPANIALLTCIRY